MSESQRVFVQSGGEAIVAEKLADGSTAIFDQRSQSVHSLNPSATVVWEVCAGGATLTQILASLEDRFGAPVDVTMAEHAIAQLRQAGLIECDEPIAGAIIEQSRRSLMKTVGALGAALPVVLTLTATEQRAHARIASSETTTAAPTTTTTTTSTTVSFS